MRESAVRRDDTHLPTADRRRRGSRLATRRGRTLLLAAVLSLALLITSGAPAGALSQGADAPIDPYASYEPQAVCDPTPKPGVVGFAKLLLEAYPVSGYSGISRDCGVRGTSEHKEGRAFDWAVSVSNPEQRAAAEDALGKLLATDADGNRHALFRRFGLMYIIFNRQIFSATQHDAGWRPYACNSAASYDDCHVNHVHFSFSTDGAMKRTSWWTSEPPPAPAGTAAVERITASTPAAAAVDITARAFPTKGSAEQVFVAPASSPHDAMVAAVMAGASHGAVLLTDGAGELERTVDAEIKRLLGRERRHRVTFVGTAETLPDDLLDTYRGRYIVRRISGADHVATARAAALDMERDGRQRTAVVVSDAGLSDALPIAAVAAANDWPMLFTGGRRLDADVRSFLRDANIEQVHLVGSADEISTRVKRQIAEVPGVRVTRHAGDNPAATSVAVAKHFFAIPSAYAVANADDLVTGAVAAAYAGERRHAPLLLTDGETLGDTVVNYIAETRSPDTGGIVVGDHDAVPREIERQLRRALR